MWLSAHHLAPSMGTNAITRNASLSTFVRSYASLSGIHNGMRRSEKVRPQGFRSRDPPPSINAGYLSKSPISERRPRSSVPAKYSSRADDGYDDFARKFTTRNTSGDKFPGRRGARRGRNERGRPGEEKSGYQGRSFRSERHDLTASGRPGKDSERGQDRPFRREKYDLFARGRPYKDSDRGQDRPFRGRPGFSDRGQDKPFRSERQDRRPREDSDGSYERSPRGPRPDRFARGEAREKSGRDQERPDRTGERSPRREGEAREKPAWTSRPGKETPSDSAEKEHHVSIPYTTAASQFLYGKSQVEAALRASRRKLYKLYVYGGANRQNIERDIAIEKLAARKGVDIVIEYATSRMDKMSGSRPHNGYVLEASPLPQLPITALGSVSEDADKPGFHVSLAHQSAEEVEVNGTSDFISILPKTHKPLILVLDQILDPGNLGAILRSANFLGVNAVVITKRNSATLTPVALKASSGAAETLTLFSVESLLDFLRDTRENGWKVYASSPATSSSRSVQQRHFDIHEVEDADPLSKDPCVLLVGNEGEGLSKQLKSKADFEVNIPNLSGSTLVDSLNVSVATALLCSSFLKGLVRARSKEFGEEREKDALF